LFRASFYNLAVVVLATPKGEDEELLKDGEVGIAGDNQPLAFLADEMVGSDAI